MRPRRPKTAALDSGSLRERACASSGITAPSVAVSFGSLPRKRLNSASSEVFLRWVRRDSTTVGCAVQVAQGLEQRGHDSRALEENLRHAAGDAPAHVLARIDEHGGERSDHRIVGWDVLKTTPRRADQGVRVPQRPPVRFQHGRGSRPRSSPALPQSPPERPDRSRPPGRPTADPPRTPTRGERRNASTVAARTFASGSVSPVMTSGRAGMRQPSRPTVSRQRCARRDPWP